MLKVGDRVKVGRGFLRRIGASKTSYLYRMRGTVKQVVTRGVDKPMAKVTWDGGSTATYFVRNLNKL